MNDNYRECLEYLSAQFEEIGGCDFYRDIFPDNEKKGELNTDFSRPNAIYLYRDEADEGTKRQLRRRIMLKDTWENDYTEYVERNPMTLCSGLSYRRRANRLENAQRMNALVIDIDGVGISNIKALFKHFNADFKKGHASPKPTYIVLSGSGIHVYYVFESPVDLYPNIKMQMKRLKYALTSNLWIFESTSKVKKVQYQSINQGFRMVGSVNGNYGMEIRAFKTGGKITLDYLNSYIRDEKDRVDVKRPFRPSVMTRAEAREKHPDWYEKVVVRGDRTAKKWDIKGKQGYALYEWWLNRRFDERLAGGHRYFFMMCLVIYACKCDVPKKKLKEDIKIVFEHLKTIDHTNELTQDDVKAALEVYSREYYNFTIKDIEYLTDIRIERNKRNGRKQAEHLKRARAVQEIDYPDGSWREGNGRQSAADKVHGYRRDNPDARKADCIRDTGLSKPTVYKWWNNAPEDLDENHQADS